MKRTLTLALCFVLFHSILAADALALAPAPTPGRQSQRVAGAIARSALPTTPWSQRACGTVP